MRKSTKHTLISIGIGLIILLLVVAGILVLTYSTYSNLLDLDASKEPSYTYNDALGMQHNEYLYDYFIADERLSKTREGNYYADMIIYLKDPLYDSKSLSGWKNMTRWMVNEAYDYMLEKYPKTMTVSYILISHEQDGGKYLAIWDDKDPLNVTYRWIDN